MLRIEKKGKRGKGAKHWLQAGRHLKGSPGLPNERVLALRGGAAVLVDLTGVVIPARLEVMLPEADVGAPVGWVHLDGQPQALLHLSFTAEIKGPVE